MTAPQWVQKKYRFVRPVSVTLENCSNLPSLTTFSLLYVAFHEKALPVRRLQLWQWQTDTRSGKPEH